MFLIGGGGAIFKDTKFNFQHKTCYEPLGKIFGGQKKGEGSTRNKGRGWGVGVGSSPRSTPPNSYTTAYAYKGTILLPVVHTNAYLA